MKYYQIGFDCCKRYILFFLSHFLFSAMRESRTFARRKIPVVPNNKFMTIVETTIPITFSSISLFGYSSMGLPMAGSHYIFTTS